MILMVPYLCGLDVCLGMRWQGGQAILLVIRVCMEVWWTRMLQERDGLHFLVLFESQMAVYVLSLEMVMDRMATPLHKGSRVMGTFSDLLPSSTAPNTVNLEHI